MTTARTYSEFEGDLSAARLTPHICKKCNNKTVFAQEWESSDGGYTDYKYTCKTCGKIFWIDGPDS